MSLAKTLLGTFTSGRLLQRKKATENGAIAFKVFDNNKEPLAPRKPVDHYNNMMSSTENILKNQSYYHKNCLSSSDELNNLNKKLNSSIRKEDNVCKEFFNSLDSKLKNINSPQETRKKRSTNQSKPHDSRPMFVTTVKTGVFLDPPPELAAILGLHSYSSSMNGSSSSTGSLHPSNGEEVVMYSFASRPRVLNQKRRCVNTARLDKSKVTPGVNGNNNNIRARQKRDLNSTPPKKTDGSPTQYGNIMFDRRVVRGSAFAQHPPPTELAKWNPYTSNAKALSIEAGGCESHAARQAEARRRSVARRKAQTQQTRALRLRIGTPPPVDGRTHEVVQTDQYMEELFDHPPTASVTCQTDFFLDRPETPIYVPAKTGRDVETQIYPGELFHFDTEVQSILEVLVGKTIEQALVEVMEEDELAAIREQQRRYKEMRAAEKAEEQRLEEYERRRREEAEKRIAEMEEASRIQRETEERVAAAVLTQGYIADLLPSVLEGLKEAGYFIDDIKQDVEENFMTWLMAEVKQEMQRMVDNRDLLSEIVREILETRAEVYRAMCDPQVPETDEQPTSTPLPGVSSTVQQSEAVEGDSEATPDAAVGEGHAKAEEETEEVVSSPQGDGKDGGS